MERTAARIRPSVYFVGLLFIIGCGSSLMGGTGGSGGASGSGGGSGGSGGGGGVTACSQSTYPTNKVCCYALVDHDPLTEPFVCNESTGTWGCSGNQVEEPSIAQCIVKGPGTGGIVGAGGSNGIGGSSGAGGSGGQAGAGGISGHTGANGNCGPAMNGQGGSECGKSGITCCTGGACDQGLRCITGDVCAHECAADGGTSSCPFGGTCQSTSACCVGTACSAAQVMVCL